MAKKKAAAKAAPTKKKPRAGSSAPAREDKLRSFVEAYISNGGNASAAAIQAGASFKSAKVLGHRLLTEVNEPGGLLEQRRKQVLEVLQVDTERVLRKLMTIAAADLTMFTNAKGGILPPSQWPAEVRGAVQSLKWGRFGPEIKLHDVKGAVETAMKHLGLFKEDNKQKGDAIAALLAKVAENNAGIRVPSSS